MNPIRLLKLYTRANKLVGLFDAATTSYNRTGGDMSKSLFASKIFWVQVLTATIELTQVLPIPSGYVAAVGAVATVFLRLLSTQPVHVIPPGN